MSVYGDMDEEALIAEIASLRQQIRTAGRSDQAGVKSVAGEGRRMEFFGGGGGMDLRGLRRLLNEATAALTRLRGQGGTAIGVRFP